VKFFEVFHQPVISLIWIDLFLFILEWNPRSSSHLRALRWSLDWFDPSWLFRRGRNRLLLDGSL